MVMNLGWINNVKDVIRPETHHDPNTDAENRCSAQEKYKVEQEQNIPENKISLKVEESISGTTE